METIKRPAVGVSTFNGGSQVSRSTDIYYQDVRPISTSGMAGVSFYITRGDSDYIEGIVLIDLVMDILQER